MIYRDESPSRQEIDESGGQILLEFGAEWCGYCQAAQPYINEALPQVSNLKHIKIKDGPGKRLGRSFKVKLWPTLILVVNGKEEARVVRPSSTGEVLSLFKT